jgi:hypothetical protein
MSAWQEYKKKLGATRPWDLLDPNTEYVDKAEAEARLNICRECPFFIKNTQQCKECGCFMNLKTKLKLAECPQHKW